MLKKVRADIPVASKPKKGEMPEIQLEGDLCKRLTDVRKAKTDAEAAVKEVEPLLTEAGLADFFALAVENPDQPPVSVKLIDEEGGIVRLTFPNKYAEVDAVVADRAFENLDADVNEYVHETVKATFDSGAFLDKTTKVFSRKAYNKFKEAIDAVAEELGVPSPLSMKTVVIPKEDFHKRRFTDFPSVEAQAALQAAMPASVQLAPLTA